VLRVDVVELKSVHALLGACISCPVLHEKLTESRARIVSLEADLKPIPFLLFGDFRSHFLAISLERF
jgi:hypothetical protein